MHSETVNTTWLHSISRTLHKQYTVQYPENLRCTTQLEWAQSRDDHGAGMHSGRSPYFKFDPEQEPESTLRSVQELNKYFKGPVKISVMMLVVCKQNGINWDVFSDQRRHISQKCDTEWEYRVLNHYWWFYKVAEMSGLWNFCLSPVLIRKIIENHQSDPVLIRPCRIMNFYFASWGKSNSEAILPSAKYDWLKAK